MHINTSRIKVKVKSLCLTKHNAMKTYWGVEIQIHSFLISALDGGKWSALRPGRFTPRETVPDTQKIGGWVDPRTSRIKVPEQIFITEDLVETL
jgi:hypothetical protein